MTLLTELTRQVLPRVYKPGTLIARWPWPRMWPGRSAKLNIDVCSLCNSTENITRANKNWHRTWPWPYQLSLCFGTKGQRLRSQRVTKCRNVLSCSEFISSGSVPLECVCILDDCISCLCSENFLTMDVFFAQLKHQNVKQLEAYQTTQLLGLSVCTVCLVYRTANIQLHV